MRGVCPAVGVDWLVMMTMIANVSGLMDTGVEQPPSPKSAQGGRRCFIRRGADDVANDAGFMTGSSSGLLWDTAATRSVKDIVVDLLAPQSTTAQRIAVAQFEETFQEAAEAEENPRDPRSISCNTPSSETPSETSGSAFESRPRSRRRSSLVHIISEILVSVFSVALWSLNI